MICNLKYSDQGWMSWKKRGDKPVKLIFRFDAPRVFNKVTLFTSNLFHLGAQVSLSISFYIIIKIKTKMKILLQNSFVNVHTLNLGLSEGDRSL